MSARENGRRNGGGDARGVPARPPRRKDSQQDAAEARLKIVPVTPRYWPALEALFGPERGADGGCWCLWWRLSRSTWYAMTKSGRKAEMKRLIETGPPPGVIALEDSTAVGWCAVAPHERYPTLERSPVAHPIDDPKSWCISCFYIAASHRRRGIMAPLIRGAVQYAIARGASTIDAFPQDMTGRKGAIDKFVGVASVFKRCGFHTVERRSEFRIAMRYQA